MEAIYGQRESMLTKFPSHAGSSKEDGITEESGVKVPVEAGGPGSLILSQNSCRDLRN